MSAGMIFLFVSLFSAVVSVALLIHDARQKIKKEGEVNELEIINSYIKDNDKSYWDHYGQGSRQKVLARQDNLVVVNFRNLDKEMCKKLKQSS